MADFSYWSPKPEIPIWNIIVGGVKVCFVAVLETLISGRIADNRTDTRFNQSKEIFGMSIANIVAGLVGGTPCTGVLIRTNVNIQTGATHKTSQFINACFVCIVALIGMPIFTYIPMSIIASILITSSCRLVPKTIMAKLWNTDKFEFWLLIVTWLVCIFRDGAVGLLFGGAVSFAKLKIEKHLSTKLREASFEITEEMHSYEMGKKRFISVKVHEPLNYINIESFETAVLDAILDKDPDYLTVNL
jgi:SulP family sulfate permease